MSPAGKLSVLCKTVLWKKRLKFGVGAAAHIAVSAVNNNYCSLHPLDPDKPCSPQNNNRPLLIIFLNVFWFLRLLLKTHPELQQHEDRPS